VVKDNGKGCEGDDGIEKNKGGSDGEDARFGVGDERNCGEVGEGELTPNGSGKEEPVEGLGSGEF
jgi:hypothetical protein